MKWLKIFLLSLICLSLWGSLYGCRNPEIMSSRRDREITIDGMDQDWQGIPFYYNEKNHLRITMVNDDRFLYITMAATIRKMRHQIESGGFTLWFDPTGGKEKTFGLRFPQKEMPPDDFSRKPPTDFQQPPFPDDSRRPDSDSQGHSGTGSRQPAPTGMVQASVPSLDILGHGGKLLDYTDMQDKPLKGILAMKRLTPSRVVYELKIPLVKSDQTPYAIGIGGLPERISICFTTEGMGMEEREGPKEPMGGRNRNGAPEYGQIWNNAMGGDMGDGGMRGGPSHGRGGGGNGLPAPHTLTIWFNVQLSGASSDTRSQTE